MSDLEKALLKDVLHLVIDKELKVLIAAIVAKLPPAAAAIEIGLEPAILPALIAALDKSVDAI